MPTGRFGRAFTLCLMGTSIAGAPAAIAEDVVTDWGARAVAIGAEKQVPNSRYARGLAMMHVAIFEAVNAIDRRYKPYKLDLAVDKGASRDAAAVAAAHEVLTSLFPDEKPKLDQALQASLAAIEGDAKTKGIELGKKAASRDYRPARGRWEQRARELSSFHHGGCVRTHSASDREHRRHDQALDHGQGLAVPAGASAGA